MPAVFAAFVKQKLHPQTDAQKGLFLAFLPDQRHQTGVLQLVHGVPKGPHAGQDDPVGGPEFTGVGSELAFQPQAGQAGAQAEQVAHAVIKNGNHSVRSLDQSTLGAGDLVLEPLFRGYRPPQGPGHALEAGL